MKPQLSYQQRNELEQRAYALVSTLVPQIAQALKASTGIIWQETHDENDHHGFARLRANTPERHTLHIRTGYQTGYDRIAIFGGTTLDCLKCADGTRPYLSRGEPENPTITVALSKSPQQIARDICNRVLPHYFAAVRCLVDQVKVHNAAEANKKMTVSRLAQATHGKVYGKGDEISFSACTVKVDHANDVDVAFRGITADEAEGILKYARVVLAGRQADREVA